jgi:hypothetical protein
MQTTHTDEQSVEKIRDILFGAQARGIEEKLSQLQSQWDARHAAQAAEHQKTIELLRQELKETQNHARQSNTQAVDTLQSALKASDSKWSQQLSEAQHLNATQSQAHNNQLLLLNQQLKTVADNSVKRETLSRLLHQLSRAFADGGSSAETAANATVKPN